MKTPRFISNLYFCLVLLLLLMLPVGQVLAADITVDADCSLANAMLSANGETMVEPLATCEAGDNAGGNNNGMDTITIDVAGTVDGKITLDATLSVSSDIAIEGKGNSINGAGNQIFTVTAGSLTLKDLTLSSGFSLTNGGAISVTDAALTLNNSAINGSGARGLGGGIYALDSDVSLIDSVVSGSLTNATIDDIVIEEEEPEATDGTETDVDAQADAMAETEDDAEAQEANDPVPEPTEEVVLPDVEGLSGGGVYFAGETSTLTIDRSGLDNNASPETGGGLYIASGFANISNSTISANQAGADGGGIYNAGNSILTHVTVVGNSAVNAGGVIDTTQLQLYNSILSDNEGGDCSGALNANIGNLIRDGSCNHDGLQNDPMLLLLAGAPAYYLPQLGSPAIDAAVADYCPATDQRGIDRLPETCDIGAAEHQPGVFNFQIQSALAALSTPDPGGSVTATLEPTEPPEPTEIPSTCLSLPSHVVVSNVTNSTQCKVVDEGGVGNQTLIDGGIYSALDIFGYLPSAIKVCFKHHTGAAVLLDAATSPRSIVPLFTWTEADKLCMNIDRPGTAVLMNLNFFTSGAITEPTWDLTNCKVTTTDILNLRSEANSTSSINANVLNGVELPADKKTTYWYRVDYYSTIGWLHSSYLSISDNC